MRKRVVIATSVVAASGAVGAGAVTLNGSDSLNPLTNDMINANESTSSPPIVPANPAAPICTGPYVCLLYTSDAADE